MSVYERERLIKMIENSNQVSKLIINIDVYTIPLLFASHNWFLKKNYSPNLTLVYVVVDNNKRDKGLAL